MKQISLIIIFLTLLANSAIGQNEAIQSKIINSKGLDIPYATLTITNSNFGKVTFEDGSFELDIKENHMHDTIIVSALGYQTKKIAYQSFITKRPAYIKLEEYTYQLDEVMVSSSKIEPLTLGITKKKSNSNFTLSTPLKGASVATRFNDKKEMLLLKEVSVVIGSENIDLLQLRCHIFSVHPVTGLPDKDLYKENLIQGTTADKKILTFTLKEEFWIDQPFFVGFEWIITKEQWNNIQSSLKAYPIDFIYDIVKANPGYMTNIYEDKKIEFRDKQRRKIKEVKFTKEQKKLLKNRNKISPILKFKIKPKGNKTYHGSSILGNWSLIPHEAFISIKVGKAEEGNHQENLSVGNAKEVSPSSNIGIRTIIEDEVIPFEDIENFVEKKMKTMDIPGVSIAIINNKKVVYHLTKGYADIDNKSLVNQKTIFEGASISKSVFAYFVMTFVDEGTLDLDRPLYEYMAYPDIEYDQRYKKITARMVLSHRSGFPNWRTDTPGDSLFIQFDPGTAYLYSGEGFQYLAKVIAHINDTDGHGLEKLFQERVAIPLGLEHTRFVQDDYNMKHKAQPYIDGRWLKRRDMGDVFGAAYSIHSEAIDFSKWMIEGLMKEAILSEKSFTELTKEQTTVPNTNNYDEGLGRQTYGLGFSRIETDFGDFYGHTGNNHGFTSFFYVLPEEGWGLVVFTNSEYGDKLGIDIATYIATGNPSFFDH